MGSALPKSPVRPLLNSQLLIVLQLQGGAGTVDAYDLADDVAGRTDALLGQEEAVGLFYEGIA